MGERAAELCRHGFVWIRAGFGSAELAFDEARSVVDECCVEEDLPAVAVVGDFILPPPDGSLSRDFQTLHFDFGVPLDPQVDQDVARYTALYIPSDRRDVRAVTRIVSLAALLGQRPWPGTRELVERLAGYGTTHGAWPDADGYIEGSLARIVEAATGAAPVLPSVKIDPGFLCGMEFANLEAELRFFDAARPPYRGGADGGTAQSGRPSRLRQPRRCAWSSRNWPTRRAPPANLWPPSPRRLGPAAATRSGLAGIRGGRVDSVGRGPRLLARPVTDVSRIWHADQPGPGPVSSPGGRCARASGGCGTARRRA